MEGLKEEEKFGFIKSWSVKNDKRSAKKQKLIFF